MEEQTRILLLLYIVTLSEFLILFTYLAALEKQVKQILAYLESANNPANKYAEEYYGN